MVKIAIAGLSVGPIYIFRNVAGSSRVGHTSWRGEPFLKMGGAPLTGGGRAYVFHNTILQPPGPPEAGSTIGCAEGLNQSGGPELLSVVSRNNILHVRNSGGYSIRDASKQPTHDYDYDLLSGKVVSAGKQERQGRPDLMQEERRLAYVGITRAKRYLYLVHAFRRTLYGSSEMYPPSQFLHDIPQHLINGKGMRGRKDQARTTVRQSMESHATTWSSSYSSSSRPGAAQQADLLSHRNRPARQPQFKPGQRATRPFWRGRGDQDRISRRRRIRQHRLCRQGRQEADGEPGEAEGGRVGWLA